MQHLSLEPITDFGKSAVSAMQSLTPVEWAMLLGTAVTVASVARVSRGALPTTEEYENVRQVRQGAEEDYKLAVEEMQKGALDNALKYVEHAITEFDLATKRNEKLTNMRINRSFSAKLLYLRAQIHYFQGTYKFAERDLLAALELYDTLIPAMNMLVHIYINHLNDIKSANVFLAKSHNRDHDQLFVKFYQLAFNKDFVGADKYATELMTLYRNHLEMKGQPSEKWDRLHATTPLLAIPDMMLKWIDYKLKTSTDSVLFFQIFKALEEILNEPELVNIKPLRNVLREAKIDIFVSLVHLREADNVLSPEEKQLAQQHCLSLTENDSTEYFVSYPVSQIDKSVISLFPLQLCTNFLTHESVKGQVGYLIQQCARQSWFVKDNNPVLIELCQALKDKTKDLANRIHQICEDNATIEYFAKNYLEKGGWNNWLRPIRCDNNSCMSFIQLACAEQKRNLCVHEATEPKAKTLQCKLFAAPDQKTPTLHLLYDGTNNKFELLHKISTPSEFYEWSAFKLAWKLLEHDVNNPRAREFLSERQCTLPAPVDVSKKNEGSLVGRMFTPFKVGAVVIAGAVAAGCYYFGRGE